METIKTTPQEQMLEFIMGKIISHCVSQAAELSISDLLGDGPNDVATLAQRAKVQPDKLYRVLRLLAAVGIYNELPKRVFENNELSDTLKSNVPGSVRNLARWFGTKIHARIYSNMGFSLKTGKPAILKDHPEMDPFTALQQYPKGQQAFQEAMTDLTTMEGHLIMEAYDLSRFATIMDVGGGRGSLARLIGQNAPEAKIYLLDLPHVIEKVKEKLPRQIRPLGGSFLSPLPAKADLIVLKRVIHDWNDKNAGQILQNCRNALNEGGKILICDALITEGPDGIPAKLMDIEMLVGNGGRDRTQQEMEELLKKAGLRLNRLISTPAQLWLMEVEKV